MPQQMWHFCQVKRLGDRGYLEKSAASSTGCCLPSDKAEETRTVATALKQRRQRPPVSCKRHTSLLQGEGIACANPDVEPLCHQLDPQVHLLGLTNLGLIFSLKLFFLAFLLIQAKETQNHSSGDSSVHQHLGGSVG